MHPTPAREPLVFDFLDPEQDKVLDHCLRKLLASDPEQLRGFMGPDPTASSWFAEYGENGFECRLKQAALREMYRDWPKWAQYKVTAYDFDGFDRLARYYTATAFEDAIRCALRQYARAFPLRRPQLETLLRDLQLDRP